MGRVGVSVKPQIVPTGEIHEKIGFGGEGSKKRVSTPPLGWGGNFRPPY